VKKISIFWFRRDLRLDDNVGLYQALIEKGNVLPLFIFDKEILDKLPDKHDRRVSFIFKTIQQLKIQLEVHGTSLLVKYGNPKEVFRSIVSEFSVDAVYTNHDYEPYALKRDEDIKTLLSENGISFKSFKDQVIFEKDDVTKDDGLPYTVFTPYMNKWRKKFIEHPVSEFPSEKYSNRFYQTHPFADFELTITGFAYLKTNFPSPIPDENIISNYDKTRDIPSMDGTSRMSIHLRFGTVSIRKLVKLAIKLNPTYLNELIWREFYMTILWHFPKVVDHAFKPKYDNIQWINDEKQFDAWCKGLTGYPIVDAGMRQLNETGFMHNRVRMIAASFLVKHLLIDWRWGEAYFAGKLLDFELSSNNGGWQWAASSGCDAAPYFRVFNPALQTKKFDPELKYINKWVPEFQDLSYPQAIVDHKFARERVLSTYKIALTE
jgi:deoxyribodipyrimidine photo-lyase